MINARGIEMELPLFLITGYHPAGFFLGFVSGLEEEVQPVFCLKANHIDGLKNITSDRLQVVANPLEINTNGIGIGRFMDAQGYLRDGYESYNKLQAVLAKGHTIGVECHPVIQALIDQLTAPSDASILPQEPVLGKEGVVNDNSGHAGDDIIPSGEPEGDGKSDLAGSTTGTITVGKRPKS
jgi:hypothetical protein